MNEVGYFRLKVGLELRTPKIMVSQEMKKASDTDLLLLKIIADPRCLLGDPVGENVLINNDGVLGHVISYEFMAKTPQKLALNLLGSFFSQNQLAKENCTLTHCITHQHTGPQDCEWHTM